MTLGRQPAGPCNSSRLLGVGVAFKIYYIMAWRAGKTGSLQSSLTRGGDLQRHHHRGCFRKDVGVELSGHAEHGQADGAGAGLYDGCTVLFQPVLTGRPRQLSVPSEQPNLREAAE